MVFLLLLLDRAWVTNHSKFVQEMHEVAHTAMWSFHVFLFLFSFDKILEAAEFTTTYSTKIYKPLAI